MKFGTKRFLVTEEQFNRLLNPPISQPEVKINHPNVVRASKFNSAISESNSNPNISDFDKVIQYSSNLNQYLNNLKNALTTSKSEAILGRSSSSIPSLTPPTPFIPTFSSSPLPTPLINTTPSSSSFLPTPPLLSSSSSLLSKQESGEFVTPEKKTPQKRKLSKSISQSINLESPPSLSKTRNIQSESVISVTPSTKPKRNKDKFTREKVLRDISREKQDIVNDKLNHLLASKKFRWNTNTGTVAIDGKTLDGMHIQGLVQDLTLPQAQFSSPSSFENINQLLRKSDSTPSSIVSPPISSFLRRKLDMNDD